MTVVVAAFNQEKALVGAFSVITKLWMELFQALVRSRPKPSGASQKVVSNLFEIKQKIPRSMNLVFSIIKKKPQVCIAEISTLSFDPDKNNQSVSMSLQNPPALSGYGAGHGLYLVSHEYKVEPRTPGPQRRGEKGVF